jgi:hypothetical protein
MAAEHNRMANRIQLRRDTTANWNNIDPVLADGEPGYDIVTNELRIGNGSNVWSELSANTISGGGGTGNTLVNGNYTVGLGANGNLTFPTGNLVIIPDDPAGNVASIVSTDHPLGILSTGANGAVASLWIEDYANVNTSNIAAVYANPTPGSKIVRIAVGQNGGAGPKLWDFGTDGNLTFPDSTVQPTAWTGSVSSLVNGASNVSISTANGVPTITRAPYISGPQSFPAQTWTFGSGPIGSALAIPGYIQGPSQTGFVSADNWGLAIDSANTPASISLGRQDGNPNLTKFFWGSGSKNGILGDVEIQTIPVGSTPTSIILSPQGGQNGSFIFGGTGNLTLPAGGTITEANVGLADALILTPANISSPGQQLRIYSTGVAVEGNHLHLTTGNLYATELYLGDDNYFVKLDNTGNVGIRATTQSLSSTALWTFDTTGNLILPAGGEIHSATGTGNVVVETNDGNNVRSWTFTGNGVIQNPVLTIATLPSASPAGQRAFVSDGADTAVTWSVAVSATGSNTYPVWSDGIVWRYG